MPSESDLWDNYFSERSDESRAAIFSYYVIEKKFVHRVARRVFRAIPKSAMITQPEDLESYGHEALYNCIDRFDPSHGVKFTTLAYSRVRGAMLDGIRQCDWIRRAGRKRQKRHGEQPPEMIASGDVVAMEHPASDCHGLSAIEARDTFRSLTRCLNSRQRRLVKLLFFDGLNNEQAAKHMHCHVKAVAEMKQQIIVRLRQFAGTPPSPSCPPLAVSGRR